MKRIVHWLPRIALIFLAGAYLTAPAQSPTEDRNVAQQTQEHGDWVDPSTGLMWAAKDNGNDVNWKNAAKYCRDLRLNGNSDWSLPIIEELERIYDGSASTHDHSKYIIAGKPKGGLLLTGAHHWSSSPILDDRGHRSGYGLEFDFWGGRRHEDPTGYSGQIRALCVRRTGN